MGNGNVMICIVKGGVPVGLYVVFIYQGSNGIPDRVAVGAIEDLRKAVCVAFVHLCPTSLIGKV